jgi:hypothetical protein
VRLKVLPADDADALRAAVALFAPSFLRADCAAALHRLLRWRTEAHAWHCDHIVPVYAGGGEATVENARTLCIPCHQRVSALQAAQRAAVRQSAKAKERAHIAVKPTISDLKKRDEVHARLEAAILDGDGDFKKPKAPRGLAAVSDGKHGRRRKPEPAKKRGKVSADATENKAENKTATSGAVWPQESGLDSV